MFKIFINAYLLILLVNPCNAQTTIHDIDGNIYRTVLIGNIEWMAENLRTTKYKDGTSIPNIVDAKEWLSLKTGAYCFYNNDSSNALGFGALYNWYAVNTGNLCPDGWRVPSDDDWKYLEGFVDSNYGIGDSIWNGKMSRGFDVGIKLKSTQGWKDNGNGTNVFGFSALPTGERVSKGKFFLINQNGFWWSSTPYGSFRAWYRCLYFCGEKMYRETHPNFMGFSVRCIRDK